MKNRTLSLICAFLLLCSLFSGCITVSLGGNFTLDPLPVYDGSPSVAVHDNLPGFAKSDCTTEPFETYSELDELGRCGVAYANICLDIMPTEPRGEIGSIRPSGWQTIRYNGLVDGNYLYNRCHLIGFQLAGENANPQNLITGTRYMNTEGMLPYENEVDDYVEETGNHVLYRVTPIFEGDNLVASGVLMEAYSVEDGGEGVCFCVYCFNVQPGIAINYATGESAEGTVPPVTTTEENHTFILNTRSQVFHNPDCHGAQSMSEKNKEAFSGAREEVLKMGYSPCGICKP